MMKYSSENEQAATNIVEYVFYNLLDEIRAERLSLGLAADFRFICLVHSHSVPWAVGMKFIDGFTDGNPIVLPSDSPLLLVEDRNSLCEAMSLLFSQGEHDTSFVDYSRPDATLLHIHNVHRKGLE